MKLPAILLLIYTLSGIYAVADPTDKLFVALIGVAANTNKSSGGHSALRIGDQVYHYQVARDKMLFLRRDPWAFFEQHYRKLDNRSLTMLHLGLRDKHTKRIHSRFNRLFVIQEKHIARWEALKIEKLWFDDLNSNQAAVPIPIVGYFDSSSRNNVYTRQLRLTSEKILGHRFINDGLGKVNTLLESSMLEASLCGQNNIKIDAYPAVSEIAAEQRLEQLALREALIILKEGRAVSPAMLVAPDDSVLSEQDRRQLQGLAYALGNSVPRLLISPRPDRGDALLLALARYGSIRQSLQQNRLLLLNIFPAKEKAIPLLDARETRRHYKLLTALSDQAGEIWNKERRHFMATKAPLTEYAYQRMENTAARYIEPRNAIRDGRALYTCSSAFLRPERAGTTSPFKFKTIPTEKVAEARRHSQRSYGNYLADLRQSYAYSLFHHNCTTELTRAIQSAFANKEEIRDSLGAVIDPEKRLAFIPSEFTRKAQRHWKTTKTRFLPSHRQAQSAKLTSQNQSPWVALRESNRWTSTIYPGSIHDDAFLFFSDGNKILRPLQGSANLAFGLANAGIGITTAPMESGRLRVEKGLRGMFYSLPEIFGVSIRKGRYDILPKESSNP